MPTTRTFKYVSRIPLHAAAEEESERETDRVLSTQIGSLARLPVLAQPIRFDPSQVERLLAVACLLLLE